MSERKIAVTAHRGSSCKAPENTIGSLGQAIADGADYAEIDVQTTADGVVVLMHDADLMRTGAVNCKLQDILYETLREIDIGSWFSGDFKNERIVKIEEAMAFSRGRIRLNIELKYNRPDPELAGKVGRIIRINNFAEKCVVSSMDYNALKKFKQLFDSVQSNDKGVNELISSIQEDLATMLRHQAYLADIQRRIIASEGYEAQSREVVNNLKKITVKSVDRAKQLETKDN